MFADVTQLSKPDARKADTKEADTKEADAKNGVPTPCHTACCRDSTLARVRGAVRLRGNKSPRYYGLVFRQSRACRAEESGSAHGRGAKAAALRLGRAERSSRKAGRLL